MENWDYLLLQFLSGSTGLSFFRLPFLFRGLYDRRASGRIGTSQGRGHGGPSNSDLLTRQVNPPFP